MKNFHTDYQLQNPMTKRDAELRILINYIEDEYQPEGELNEQEL